jgi:hypothetical protein
MAAALAAWLYHRSMERSRGTIDAKEIALVLGAMAEKLESFIPLLSGCEMGLRSGRDIAAAGRLAQILVHNPTIGNIAAALDYLADFRARVEVIALTSRVASMELRTLRGKSGRVAHDWYDDFTRFLVSICTKNGIKPTVITDRVSGEPRGRLLEMALGFEKLLRPTMRSPTPQAAAKRVGRSLNRIRKDKTS